MRIWTKLHEAFLDSNREGRSFEIKRYIAIDNPAAAKRWIERLKSRARNALDAPFAGRVVPEFCQENIRELIEGNYRIVYQVFDKHLIILTVFEGHQIFPSDID
jgi:toxin ParE1/3/4